MRRLLKKGYLIFMIDGMLYSKDKSGRVLACVEITKNKMCKLNVKIKTFSVRCEWKVKDKESF